MKVQYTKQALKFLKTCNPSTRELIRIKIKGLTEIPPKGDIKALQGSKTMKRLRVGKYRIIYEYLKENEMKILMVNKIDSRGGVSWDPDYTKLTPQEAVELGIAQAQVTTGDVFDDEEIDWENLDSMELN